MLTGSLKLEGFINLKKLDCFRHELTELDLSNCPKLKKLDCSVNSSLLNSYDPLTELNLSNCIELEELNCSLNRISKLEVNHCLNLKEIDFSCCQSLTSVNLVNCINLTHIWAGACTLTNRSEE